MTKPTQPQKQRKRYCLTKATTLQEILETCDRHIENIRKTHIDLLEEGDGSPTDDFYCSMIREMWKDMRDDVQEMLEAERVFEAKRVPVKHTVYIVEATEHEFGQRPDGYSVHLTMENAKEFLKHTSKDRRDPVPAAYVSYAYYGSRTCGPEFYQRLQANATGIVFIDKLSELKA